MATYESILAQALELPEDEQELLLVELGLSMASVRPTLDPAWERELERRLAALAGSDAELIDWEEAEALIFDD